MLPFIKNYQGIYENMSMACQSFKKRIIYKQIIIPRKPESGHCPVSLPGYSLKAAL
jgi:hypothetical protein